jgi:hypothetical protein
MVALSAFFGAWLVSPLWEHTDPVPIEIAGVILGSLTFYGTLRHQVFGHTMIRTTPESLEWLDKRRIREPWQNVAAVSIGTHATIHIDKRWGRRETHRSYSPILIIERAGGGPAATLMYRSWFDQPWEELFRHIHAVAPHVRLYDVRQSLRDAHERDRPSHSKVIDFQDYR